MYTRYFWQLCIHKVSLRWFDAFPIFKNLISGKRLVLERNEWKFGTHGQVFNMCRVLLTFKCSRAFWGHSVHSYFQQPCIWIRAGRRVKRTTILDLGGNYWIYTGYFWKLSVQIHCDVIQCISNIRQHCIWKIDVEQIESFIHGNFDS